MKRKLLSVLLALCLALTLLPTAAFAEEVVENPNSIENENTEQSQTEDGIVELNSTPVEVKGGTITSAEELVAALTPTTEGAAAVATANGSTVTLTSDVVLNTNALKITSGNITLDLNGHSISGQKNILLKGGTFELTGEGTISRNTSTDTYAVIQVSVENGADTPTVFTMGKDVTVNATSCYGIVVLGASNSNGVTATINGTVTSTTVEQSAISGNGNGQYHGTTITIGSTANITCEKKVAIYFPQSGTLEIEDGARISGLGGVEMKGGTLTIEGNPIITATSQPKHVKCTDGPSTEGYAIAAVENKSYVGEPNITISNGTYNGPVSIVKDDADLDKHASVTINGGIFSSDPFDESTGITAPEGYASAEKDGKYVVAVVPKADEGTTVEPTVNEAGETTSVTAAANDKDGNATGTKAEIPAEIAEDLSSLTVTVKSSTVDASQDLSNSVSEGIKEAITSKDAKIVEVTITKTGADGTTEEKQFTDKNDLSKTPITITIDGLTKGTQYYIFCIMDNGTVTSYGYVTPDSTSISFTTTHLCKFGAAPVPTDETQKAALVEAVKADTTNHETTTIKGGTTAAPDGTTSTTAKYTRDTTKELGKVEITGTKEYYYVIQATNAKNSAPGLIYCVQANAQGKAEVYCNKSCDLMVLESSTMPDLSKLTGLAEVKPA